MSRKRPTADQMGNLLSQPHFRRAESTEAPASTQAVTATPMLVDVDKIVPYDRNPRRNPNERYDEIKDSIRATGLDQGLIITQRPDAADPNVYMISAGGNTRIVALQELWRETGDDRFKQVWCQFRPWVGETQTLLAHIRENDLRSDLTFIDRALAIQELRQMLEAEAGKTLSQRELRDQLKAYGYQVSHTMIRWYDYTVDTLHPAIPTVLQSGMGRPQIQRIYELQRGFARAWASLGLGDDNASEAAELFTQTLQRLDNEILEIEALRQDLETELSVSADCDIQRASLELGAALAGRDGDAEPADTGETTSAGNTASSAPDATGTAPRSEGESPDKPPRSPAPPAAPISDGGSEARTTPHPAVPAPGAALAPPDEVPAAPPRTAAAGASELPSDVKSLRARCWTLANRLAQGTRLGQIVMPIHAGLGFLVSPVPVEVQTALHPEAARTAVCTWWHLATLAEQFARHGHACAFMPDDWQERRIGDAMRHARDSNQAFAHWQWTEADRDLFNDVPGLEPNDIGPLLYQVWTDQRWADWVGLVETGREIYRKTNNDPWGDRDANQGI